MIFGGDIKSHFLVFGDSSAEGHADLMAVFRKVAVLNPGKLVHVYVDSAKADNGRILEFFGIKKEDGHVTRIIQVNSSVYRDLTVPLLLHSLETCSSIL